MLFFVNSFREPREWCSVHWQRHRTRIDVFGRSDHQGVLRLPGRDKQNRRQHIALGANDQQQMRGFNWYEQCRGRGTNPATQSGRDDAEERQAGSAATECGKCFFVIICIFINLIITNFFFPYSYIGLSTGNKTPPWTRAIAARRSGSGRQRDSATSRSAERPAFNVTNVKIESALYTFIFSAKHRST